MDYSFGIASSSRTLVVVPTMFGSAAGVEALVEALEVRFLANRDPNLHFGLLTDLHDAASEHMPADAELVELAAARIEALNAKYLPAADAQGTTAFYLFHRPRRWNARDRVWMGHERKRGKLADLNALLRGQAGAGPGEAFARLVGGAAVAVGGALCDHAGHGHGAARRRRRADGGDDGASGEPAALRRRQAARPGRRRVRHPGAAHRVEPAKHEPLGVCPPARRRAGYNQIHDAQNTPDDKVALLTVRTVTAGCDVEGKPIQKEGKGVDITDGKVMFYDFSAKKLSDKQVSVCLGCHKGMGLGDKNAVLCGIDSVYKK